MTATALISMWVSNTATCLMILPIALAVVSQVALANPSDAAGVRALGISLLLGMAVAITAGLLSGAAPAAAPKASTSGAAFSQLALIFILLTYGGWNEAAYITAEVRDPRRNIVRALVIGIVTVTVLYVLLNLAYVNVLGLDGMKASKALAADLMQATLGGAGAIVLSVIVIASALSTLNATVFTGARTNYALGRDYAIFAPLGRWKEGANAPVNALLLQGGIALLLVLLVVLPFFFITRAIARTEPTRRLLALPGGGYPGDGFHTYTTDWDANALKWYIDGKLVWARDLSTTPWYDQAFNKLWPLFGFLLAERNFTAGTVRA